MSCPNLITATGRTPRSKLLSDRQDKAFIGVIEGRQISSWYWQNQRGARFVVYWEGRRLLHEDASITRERSTPSLSTPGRAS